MENLRGALEKRKKAGVSVRHAASVIINRSLSIIDSDRPDYNEIMIEISILQEALKIVQEVYSEETE